jgi:hypothetical protein
VLGEVETLRYWSALGEVLQASDPAKFAALLGHIETIVGARKLRADVYAAVSGAEPETSFDVQRIPGNREMAVA